jgi:hypothetical protein
METKDSSFSLDDSAADRFYSGGDNAYATAQRGTEVERLDVDESGVRTGFAARALEHADVSRYTTLFQVTGSDVVGRVVRASLPYRRILEPPPSPPALPTTRRTVEEDSGADERSDEEHAVEDNQEVASPFSPSSSTRDDARPVTSVESAKPFNTNPDLYGATWVPVTLILATSMGSTCVALLRSVVSRQDVFHGARLSSLDFTVLVTAAAGVTSFIAAASICVLTLKRYVNDGEDVSLPLVLCVYGYSMAPLIPAVLLSPVLSASPSSLVLCVAVVLSTVTVLRNLWPNTEFVPDFLRARGAEDGESAGQANAVGRQQHQRSPLWWLRFGVAAAHLLAGLALKVRFF